MTSTEWQPIETAPVGIAVKVRHELSTPSYDTEGVKDADGAWSLGSLFVVPLGKRAILSSRPTHWQPK